MQKRKFDELISHFNRKVSDMGIDQKYKMELLGMISAIGFAHEKELGTNLAEVGTDCISRQQAIDIAKDLTITVEGYEMHNQAVMNYCADIMQLPPIQPEIVRCKDCKYAEYIDDVQTLWCTECGQGRTVAPNDFCSYAERRE